MKRSFPEDKAAYASNPNVQLSGTSYVSAVPREYLHMVPLKPHRVRLPLPGAGTCEHGVTICATWECIESWSMDYRLFLHRTVAGREIAAKLRIEPTRDLDHLATMPLRHEDFVMEDPA